MALIPLIVTGRTDTEWLVKRTRAAFEAGETIVWWRIGRRGYSCAQKASRRLEGFILERQHFAGRPETLWSWRTSKATAPVGAMWIGE
jgi:hypothetical protein